MFAHETFRLAVAAETGTVCVALHVNSTLKPGPQFATWRVQIILIAKNTYVSLKHITQCPAKIHP